MIRHNIGDPVNETIKHLRVKYCLTELMLDDWMRGHSEGTPICYEKYARFLLGFLPALESCVFELPKLIQITIKKPENFITLNYPDD